MPMSDTELIEIHKSRQHSYDADSQVICELAREIMTLRRSLEEIQPLMDRIVSEDCSVQPCYSKALLTKMKIQELLPREARVGVEQKE